ncbi:hypothetical protein GIB67_008954 [Kingdonia uniflora]|uniref:Transposase n=1 Tax=Kingdonia uniflora TaxID=39325 RepID=A0A7J7LVT1_9MAGN|nr:hypothetical protein GIB67_008954 [Kingdonia uniflora]
MLKRLLASGTTESGKINRKEKRRRIKPSGMSGEKVTEERPASDDNLKIVEEGPGWRLFMERRTLTGCGVDRWRERKKGFSLSEKSTNGHENETMLTGGQEASSSTTSVVGRKRGPSRGATMLPNGEKRDVSANDLGQPNRGGKNHHKFISTLGVLTRTHIPIIYSKITDVTDEDIKNVIKGLEKGFYFPHVSEMYLRDRLATFWRNFKSDKYIKNVKGKILVLTKANNPEFVPIDDWHHFVDNCNSAAFQTASVRKSANRENLTTPAYVGRDSMAVIRHRRSVDKDRKGRLIGLGAGVCPTLLKKAKHLLIQNEDLRDTNIELAGKVDVLEKDLQKVKDTVNVLEAPNLHLNKKYILNGFSKVKVARGEVAFVDPTSPIH